MKHFCSVVLFALIAAFFSGCGDDGNNWNDVENKFFIIAYIGGEFGAGNFGAYVTSFDSTGGFPANACTLTVNGTNAPVVFGSTSIDAIFRLLSFGYNPGTQYTVRASYNGKTAQSVFTAPLDPGVEISTPVDGSTISPGNTFNMTWVYGSAGTPAQVRVLITGGTSGDAVLYDQDLAGTTTSINIPASSTSSWGSYPQINLSVDCGEYAYPLEGDLCTPGSAVTTILSGCTSVIYPDTGAGPIDTTWLVTITPSQYTLNANGTSSTTLSIRVETSAGEPCPNGTTVIISAQPSSLVSIAPSTVTTSDGNAASTATAGTVAGNVEIAASALGARGTTNLQLIEDITLSITVGAGTHPQISWTPASQTMYGMVIRKTGVAIGNMRWAFASAVGFSTPVVYGTIPPACTQTFPLGGAAPAALVAGDEYIIGLVTAGGDTAFYTFTR